MAQEQGGRAPAGRAPRVVAELGRPETPEETAARKAESSRNHRANQTLRNLVLSLLATLAVVAVLVVVVVRPDPGAAPTIDWHRIAADSQADAALPLLDPRPGEGWSANAATLTTGNDDVQTWYIGFLTPGEQFIGLEQGIGANPTWVAQRLDSRSATGTEQVDGRTWDVYDYRGADDPGNLAYAMVLETAPAGDVGQTVVLYGTAQTAEFRVLAAEIGSELE